MPGKFSQIKSPEIWLERTEKNRGNTRIMDKGKILLNPEFEAELKVWLFNKINPDLKHDSSLPLTEITVKAKEIANSLKLDRKSLKSLTKHWMQEFLKRHDIQNVTIKDEEEAEKQCKKQICQSSGKNQKLLIELQRRISQWIFEKEVVRQQKVKNHEIRRKSESVAKVIGLQGFSVCTSWFSQVRKKDLTLYIPQKSGKDRKVMRRSFTASYKIQVVQYAEAHGKVAAVKHFGVNEKNVREWTKLKNKLMAAPGNKRANRAGTASFPELERLLYSWIMKMQDSGKELKRAEVCEKAIWFAAQMAIQNFSGSYGWYRNFCKRYPHHVASRRKFSPELKLKILRCAKIHGRRIAAEKFDVSQNYIADLVIKSQTIRKQCRHNVNVYIKKHYTSAFKAEVVGFAERKGNMAAERKYKINQNRIEAWKSLKDIIALCLMQGCDTRCRCYTALFRLQVIKFSEVRGTAKAASEFSLPVNLVQYWRRKKAYFETAQNYRTARYKQGHIYKKIHKC